MSAVRRVVGKQIKKAVHTTGLHALLRRVCPSRYPVILRYHSIGKASILISDGITVSPGAFEEQVHYFSKHFCTTTMTTLVDCVRDRRPFPKNALVLTFDDGFADNYGAAKILHKYGLTGLFYITAGCIESEEKFWVAEIRHLFATTNRHKVCLQVRDGLCEVPLSSPAERTEAIDRVTYLIKSMDVRTREGLRQELWEQLDDVPPFPQDLMLTWKQLNEMVAMGMEIGGHTMTHCNLPSATNEEAGFELAQCKLLLEKQLGIEVRHFAYPNGGCLQHYNDRVKDLVGRAGFFSASTSKPGLVGLDTDLLELWRVRARENLSEMLWEMEECRWGA